ncbi:uncharacterized protein LOC128746182 [Sabethes cyaneus]|uniref:uncharacterized protein LOC128746182 n=1 Tax=Sabethes cyaneus TaxID=53552 RepID=UPI00237DB766|nr:uncharacterized protein LOC128746182 [Sabethes cyaneus]
MACIVKECNRHQKHSPSLHFFPVPKNLDARRLWFHRCGIYVENPMPKLFETKSLFVCENHFEPSDYRIINVKCENPRQPSRQRFLLYPDILPHKNLPLEFHNGRYSFLRSEEDPLKIFKSSTGSRSMPCCTNPVISDENVKQLGYTQYHKRSKLVDISSRDNVQKSSKQIMTDRSVITDSLIQSSASVQCSVPMENRGTQTLHTMISYKAVSSTPNSWVQSSAGSTLQSRDGSAGSVYLPSTESMNELKVECHSNEFYSQIQMSIKTKSMNYLGISQDNYFVIDALTETTGIRERDLIIVFRKIRLNESFEILSDAIGLTAARVGQIFSTCVPIVAREMKELIFWPADNEIKKFLPVSFLNKYSTIQSIIDCFELRLFQKRFQDVPVIKKLCDDLVT